MCTAVSLNLNHNYFGRNLDLDFSYGEKVTVTPRKYKFTFSNREVLNEHYAMIGMAYIKNNYPLYYDATNEKGLSMAGLNFPDNAFYFPEIKEKNNISPFELIPYILSKCKNVAEAQILIKDMNLLNVSFSKDLPLTPLHWIISDKERSITVESDKTGLLIYENPAGVLTNNPPFELQYSNLNNYMNLSINEPVNNFINGLKCYSRGMGAIGLPGDFSSMSRFVRATFAKANSLKENEPEKDISQFFHILSFVEQVKGCVKIDNKFEITQYTSCCDTDEGVYYYKTYYNNQITAVDMHNCNLNNEHLYMYETIKKEQIFHQNK